jgi:hypothetical protein
MARLRSPTGCPWDREQNHMTLRRHAIEEVYELIDAIEAATTTKWPRNSAICCCRWFSTASWRRNAARLILKKSAACSWRNWSAAIRTFWQNKVKDVDEVWANWEKIKKAEKHGTKHARHSALDGIPKHLPALLRAENLVKKARKAGWLVHFERTSDLGKTWQATPPVNDGKTIGAIQPSILFQTDGKLEAIGRTRNGRIFKIWSGDGGVTWGRMLLTDLPNPDSGTDAVTLKDGRQLLVYNHNTEDKTANKGRSPLNVALSDDGLNWQAALVLEDNPSAPSGFAYPAVIQTGDGLVHITYTWKRKRIKHVVTTSLPAGGWKVSRRCSSFSASSSTMTSSRCLGRMKPSRNGVVEKFQHGAVKARHVQQPERFLVIAELAPRQHLAKFLAGAVTAGQRDEAVGVRPSAPCARACFSPRAGRAVFHAPLP